MAKYFFTIFILLTIHTLSSQNSKKLDSLILEYKNQSLGIEKINIAENIFTNARQTNPQLALEYLHKGLGLSKKLNSQEGLDESYTNLGLYYVNYHNLDSLRFYFSKAQKSCVRNDNKMLLFKVLYRWAKAENLEGNFEKALELNNNSIKMAYELQNGLKLSDTHQQKATIYLDNGNYNNALRELILASKALDTIKNKIPIKEAIIKVGIGRTETLRNNYLEAITYLEDGISIFESVAHEKWLAISYMELGNTYYSLKDYDNALLYYNKGLKISEENKWDYFIAPYLENIGAVYLDTKKYDKALNNFFASNKISSKHGSVNNQIIFFNDIASAYFGKKDYKNALKNYNKAIQIADSINSIDNLSDNYKERAEVYETINNYKKATLDYKKHILLNDSIFNIAKTRQIDELKTQYETEKKEQQILLQNKEIDLLKQKEKNNNLQRLLLGIGLLLSIIGIYAVRQKLKRNKLEKEKLDNELAFKKKELTTHALHLAKKNEVLEGLKQKAKEFNASPDNNQNGYQQLIRTINFDLKDDNNWDNFSIYFQEVHKDFNNIVKQKYPEVTPNELRLMSLLKMNLSSKEIANILNISPAGIKKARYRLRKKLNINTDDSLQDLILSL